MSKFEFDVELKTNGDINKYVTSYKVNDEESYDITSNTLLNNKDFVKYLTINKWPEIWSCGGTTPSFTNPRHPSNPKRKGWGHHEVIDSKFQKPASLGYLVNKFKVYVNNKEYFMSNFKPLEASWSKGKVINEMTVDDIRKAGFDYKTEPYFAMIAAAYVTTFLSGISVLNLQDRQGTPKVITSIVRYHLYYTISKFMKNPALLDKYDLTKVKEHIPIKYKEYKSVGVDGDGHHVFPKAAIEFSNKDYLSLIAYNSNGLTSVGRKLFQESIESYVYCVLGAQAKTRWSIVNMGAKSSQTQDVFHQLANDTIVQSDPTVTITNMRAAIRDTNVVLNMAITPGVILIPSSMIILSKIIAGSIISSHSPRAE